MPIDSFVHRHVHSEPFYLRERVGLSQAIGLDTNTNTTAISYLSVEGELELVLDDRVVVVEPGQTRRSTCVIRSVHSRRPPTIDLWIRAAAGH